MKGYSYEAERKACNPGNYPGETEENHEISHSDYSYSPNFEYDAGGMKQLSSTTHVILSSSIILVIPGISSSKPNMLPNVILALST